MLPIELSNHQFQVGELNDVQLIVSSNETLIACSEVIRDRTSVWTFPSGQPCLTVDGGAGLATVFSASSSFVATCGTSLIRIQSLNSTSPAATMSSSEGIFGDFGKLCISNDESFLVAASHSWLSVWNLSSLQEVAHIQFGKGLVVLEVLVHYSAITVFLGRAISDTSVDFVPQYKELSFVGNTPFVFHQYTIPFDGDTPRLSIDGMLAVYCVNYSKGQYAIWNRASPTQVAELSLSPNMAHEFSLSFDSKLIAHGYRMQGDVAIHDAATGSLVNTIRTPPVPPRFLFSPVSNLLALVTNDPDKQVDATEFVDPLTGTTLAITQGHPVLAETSHCFSPRGNWFISASTTESLPYQARPLPSGTIVATDLTRLSSIRSNQ